MKVGIVVAVLLSILAIAGYYAVDAWSSMEVEIGGHGTLALVLGIVFSFVIGAGLMALVFYSHRKGHDDIDRGPRDDR